MSGQDWLSALPQRFRAALAAELPPNIALMRLMSEATSEAELAAILVQAQAAAPAAARSRLEKLDDLACRLPGAWVIVRGVIDQAAHDGSAVRSDTVEHWAALFDRLVVAHPEASVALYSFGSPAILAAATDEIVGRLREWDLLGPDRHVLEVGCGIGRFVAALAPLSASVLGLDVSGEMVAEARRRCGTLANVRLEQGSGRDLAVVPSRSVDLVLAVDVFPYLVLAGVAEAHVAEAARVLRPGGALAIFNYSYRGDPARDRAEVEESFGRAGFATIRAGTRDLRHWDGVTFLARLDR